MSREAFPVKTEVKTRSGVSYFRANIQTLSEQQVYAHVMNMFTKHVKYVPTEVFIQKIKELDEDLGQI